MKVFNSIKWRLQIWHGLILVIVLAGFGFIAWQQEYARLLGRMDEEMRRRMGAIVGALQRPPHRPNPEPLPNGPPPNTPPDRLDDRFESPSDSPGELHLPQPVARLFDETDTNGFYYVLWALDGKILAFSTNAPASAMASFPLTAVRGLNVKPSGKRMPPPEPLPPLMRGEFREIASVTPPGEIILVGRSLTREMHVLQLGALRLTAVGVIILFVGFAGGWWFVGRSLRPIDNISAAAARISAGDLSQRINVAETESELGQLAGILNSTFSRLETAFAQQRQFTADAAHELRTPVSVMLTQTQTALNRERSAAEYRETIEVCERAAQRMRRLTESLLELARLDAGQEPIKRLKFDLSPTIWDCVELVRPLAAKRGVKIHCELPAVEAHGDAEQLAKVITNLLANAVQYNKDNGEVQVSAKLQGGMILLAVSDTGQGISAGDLPRVFERFYRSDQARSSGQTGLGLAISKAIVEAHGGTIEVLSKAGVGTTFTVVLPAM